MLTLGPVLVVLDGKVSSEVCVTVQSVWGSAFLRGLNASSPVEETVLFGSDGLFCQLMSLSHQYVWDPELTMCTVWCGLGGLQC